MWNYKIAMATASKWRPDLKTLARKKSMRLKLTASGNVPRKTVVTPLIQHNNNNWPSSRTKYWSLWVRKRRQALAATTRQHHSFIDVKVVQIIQRTSRVPLQPLNIQSSAVVSSGHIYNFHNYNVVQLTTNQGQAYSNIKQCFFFISIDIESVKTLPANYSWHLKLFKLTFPFWAWVIQFPSSMQNTSATIYQYIQLKLLSFFALCSKFWLISIKNLSALAVAALLVHSCIRWRQFQPIVHGILTAHPILQLFLSKNKAWLKSFTSEN